MIQYVVLCLAMYFTIGFVVYVTTASSVYLRVQHLGWSPYSKKELDNLSYLFWLWPLAIYVLLKE